MTNARQARSAREKAAQMRAETVRKQARQRTAAIGGALAALIVIVVAVGILVVQAREDDKTVTAPAHLTDGGMLVGDADAPITVEIYEDFICPACTALQTELADELATWKSGDTVRVIYRPVAILDEYSTTDYSTRALNAFAAVLDTSPESAEPYFTLLFENQPPEGGPGLTDDVLLDLAERAGADRAAIEPAISSLAFKDWVNEQNEHLSKNYQKDGKVGTPTVVVDGEALENPFTLGTVVSEKSNTLTGSAGGATQTTTTAPSGTSTGQ
jgi:protein-disulfide isomerase